MLSCCRKQAAAAAGSSAAGVCSRLREDSSSDAVVRFFRPDLVVLRDRDRDRDRCYRLFLPQNLQTLTMSFELYPAESTIYLTKVRGLAGSPLSGTQLVRGLQRFAVAHDICKIQLIDASALELREDVSIPLSYLSLLATGRTWYNRLGFLLEDRDEQRRRDRVNADLLRLPMRHFLDRCLEQDHLHQQHAPATCRARQLRLHRHEIRGQESVQAFFARLQDALRRWPHMDTDTLLLYQWLFDVVHRSHEVAFDSCRPMWVWKP